MLFFRRKKIRSGQLQLTNRHSICPYSTILGMDGMPKQEGVVLLEHKPKGRREIELIPMMYADNPQEIAEFIQKVIV